MSSGFLLDTNVLSELMRNQPAVALLPAGQGRTPLATSADQTFEQDFASHCLAFDAAAAKHYAVLVAARTRLRQLVSTENAQIAAIALAAGLTVAIRSIKDFENIKGLTLANPWLDTTPAAPH